MRKITRLIIVLLIAFALNACAEKPGKIAKEFLEAMERHDYETAKSLTTESGHEIISLLESFSEHMSDEQREETLDTRYKILRTDVDGDAAVAHYEYWSKSEPDSVSTGELPMVREEGEWKVNISKDDAQK